MLKRTMTSSAMQADSGLEYTVSFSNRRRVTIVVERDGSIIVRAPEGTSSDKIASIVQEKERWIREKVEHPQKFRPGRPPGKELVSGESMLYLGRNYRVEITKDSNGVILDQHFLIPRTTPAEARRLCREWYVARAHDRLVARATHWGKELGVELGGIAIVEDRYRWGSCSESGRVRLNWRLIKAPSSVIDYVIVHELAHLLEANHGDRFWSIVRSQLTNVEGSRNWLRENGQLLEEDL